MNIRAVTFPKWDESVVCDMRLLPKVLQILEAATRLIHSLTMDWQAFWLTMRLSVTVTCLLVILGLPLAYWMASSRWRWKFLIEAVVGLPIVLPPTVLGFYV